MSSRIRRGIWCGALLALLLAIFPGTGVNAAREGTETVQELPIQIRVVPEDTGLPLSPVAPGSPVTGNADAARPMPGTVSAVLVGAPDRQRADPQRQASFFLIVEDGRPSAEGWQVMLADAQGERRNESILLDRYWQRTETLAGQPTTRARGPHGYRLSVGQPLDASPLVMLAHPGAGHGVYRLPFGVIAVPAETPVRITLVLTLPSAP